VQHRGPELADPHEQPGKCDGRHEQADCGRHRFTGKTSFYAAHDDGYCDHEQRRHWQPDRQVESTIRDARASARHVRTFHRVDVRDGGQEAVLAHLLRAGRVKAVSVDELLDHFCIALEVREVCRLLQVQRSTLLAGPCAVGVHARAHDATTRAAREECDQCKAACDRRVRASDPCRIVRSPQARNGVGIIAEHRHASRANTLPCSIPRISHVLSERTVNERSATAKLHAVLRNCRGRGHASSGVPTPSADRSRHEGATRHARDHSALEAERQQAVSPCGRRPVVVSDARVTRS
jgi:hypothetical protein